VPFARDKPYNELPKLPPVAELETKAALKLTIRANAALAELKGAEALIPNPATLVRAIVLQEAKLSSEIENIVTTNDELYRAMSRDSAGDDPRTKEVLRYGEAVWAGVRHLDAGRPISPRLFEELATIINDAETDVRKLPGTRIGNPLTGEVRYTPPEGTDRIRGLLDNLCGYLSEERAVEALIRLAAAHYQFEAIHPFRGGNGRTGRIVNVLYLIQRGLLRRPVLYLSGYLIEGRADYYRLLSAVTERGCWEDWVLFMLEGIETTAIETRRRIEAIHRSMTETQERVRQLAPSVYSRELIELVYSQPYTRISAVEQSGIAKRQTASMYLRKLEKIGVLRSERIWRETLYLNEALFELLSA